jgi:hypothetical protein
MKKKNGKVSFSDADLTKLNNDALILIISMCAEIMLIRRAEQQYESISAKEKKKNG